MREVNAGWIAAGSYFPAWLKIIHDPYMPHPYTVESVKVERNGKDYIVTNNGDEVYRGIQRIKAVKYARALIKNDSD